MSDRAGVKRLFYEEQAREGGRDDAGDKRKEVKGRREERKVDRTHSDTRNY